MEGRLCCVLNVPECVCRRVRVRKLPLIGRFDVRVVWWRGVCVCVPVVWCGVVRLVSINHQLVWFIRGRLEATNTGRPQFQPSKYKNYSLTPGVTEFLWVVCVRPVPGEQALENGIASTADFRNPPAIKGRILT